MQTFANMVRHVETCLREFYPDLVVCGGPRRGFTAQWQWKVDMIVTLLKPSDVLDVLPDYLEPLNIEVETHAVPSAYRIRVKETGHSRRGTIYVRSSFGDDFGALVLYYTGPVRFLEKLQERARELGYIFDARGLLCRGELIAGKSEVLIFDALGVKMIAPEDRTNTVELEYTF